MMNHLLVTPLFLLGLIGLFISPMISAKTSAKTSAMTTANNTTAYQVDGLSAEAEIIIDEYGVPHIYANDHYDVFFVQGFNAARDRLWQIDLWKRRGLGQLAEILGEQHVAQDKAARLFVYRGDMYAEWLAYGNDAKRITESFTAGINAYIEVSKANPELMAVEFDMLGYTPSKWSADDVVRILSIIHI